MSDELENPEANDEWLDADPAFYRHICDRVCEASLPEAILILRHLALKAKDPARSAELGSHADSLAEFHRIFVEGFGTPPIVGTRLWRAFETAPIAQISFEFRAHPASPETSEYLRDVADKFDVEVQKIALWFKELRRREGSQKK